MKKVISFLGSKIGISLLVFFVIIGVALLLKNKESAPKHIKDSDIVVAQLADKLLDRENERGIYKTWEEVNGTSTSATSTTEVKKPSYTSTDLFSQEIFKEYLATKQAGGTIDASTSEEIANSVLSKSYPTDEAKINTIADIKTTPSTYMSLVSYANSVAIALKVPLPKGYNKSELELLEDIVNNPGLLGTIDFKPLRDRYDSMRTKLLSMKVPVDVAKGHVAILNGFNNVILSVEGMMALTTDPIGALGKTAAYQNGIDIAELGFTEIKSVLKDKGVSFSPDEPAYSFFN